MSEGLNRKNQILIAVLVVQVILAVVLLWPRTAKTVSGEPMFADLDLVVGVRIADGVDKSITLAKSGEAWVLSDAGDYPVQDGKVQSLLDKIAGFKTDRLVTQTAASHRRLQVAADEFVRRVTLTWADGTSKTFWVGSAPNYGAIHIRQDRQDQVYLVSDLSTVDLGTGAANWIDTLYLGIETMQIVELTIENANGTLTFVKGEDEVWTMAGLQPEETLLDANITTLLSHISSLRMIEPLGKQEQAEYGTQTPSALVTVKTRDDEGSERTIILRIGTEDNIGNYVVISSLSPYYVRVNGYSVQDFVDQTREDFIAPPPTPEAE